MASFDWLSGFDRIYLCFDNDTAGREAVQSVAQLFDFKEHLAALALALVLAAAVAGIAQGRGQPGPQRWTLASLSLAGAAMLWAATLIGLYVTARHPV